MTTRAAWCAPVLGVALTALLSSSGTAKGIVNGDFEAGNTGFSSGYTDVAELCNENGLYTVGSNPATANCYGDWVSIGDHTTGGGLMMILDGSTAGGTPMWSEQIKTKPNTDYVLTFWATTVVTTDWGNAPSIQAEINGLAVGDLLQLPATYDGRWHKAVVKWNSGSSKQAAIALVDTDTASDGNDFAVDDISFKKKH